MYIKKATSIKKKRSELVAAPLALAGLGQPPIRSGPAATPYDGTATLWLAPGMKRDFLNPSVSRLHGPTCPLNMLSF